MRAVRASTVLVRRAINGQKTCQGRSWTNRRGTAFDVYATVTRVCSMSVDVVLCLTMGVVNLLAAGLLATDDVTRVAENENA